jgi:lon-related putative ATP-dependent protease
MSQKAKDLTVEDVWNACCPEGLGFETTQSLPSKVSIIGQDRAVQAISFGVGVDSFGFNIYALGFTGTGRATTVNAFLERIAAPQPVPDDWIYVHNFADPNRPNAIRLPPGLAIQFRDEIKEVVDDLLRDIPRAFESEEYEQRKEQIMREMQAERNQAFSRLEQQASDHGFALVKTAVGLGVAPVLDGQVLSPEGYQQLDQATQQEIEARQEALQSEVVDLMRSIRDLEKSTKRRLQDFDREIADSVVAHGMQEVKQKYQSLDELPEYLDAVHADIVDNASGFRGEAQSVEGLAAAMQGSQQEALLKRYAVNVLVDHGEQEGAPVIFEANPTYSNLVGRIEHRAQFGALVTDLTMIRPGSLHRANGGYLVVEARGLLTNPAAWDALKRSIKNRRLRTEEIGSQLQLVSTVTLEPEPIPLDVKVIVLGDGATYYLLYEYDEDFRKLFKVQADFGIDFDRTAETCHSYALFIAARCHEEGLLHFEALAVARIVEFGSRLAEHQHKLSTRFGEIADVVREASYWAKQDGQDRTTAAHVDKALAQRIYRANRVEESIQEMIDDGTLQVDTDGQVVGQVNALSVLSLGNYTFGKPSRITVRTYSGKEGVVSLDREARLSGRIYDKGVLTLTGYLGGKYAAKAPLSLAATISFEQLYEMIEGDSASSSELYALLSSLSHLPLKQALAVTGSVDQQGNIQPVGGVNEKIEGFFDTSRKRGLNGEQGVIVPARNVVNLMLNAEVRSAIQQGLFHVYAVNTIDEGLELLTGMTAGELQEDGTYPEDSIHGRVAARLKEISEQLRERGEEEEEDKRQGIGGDRAEDEEDDDGDEGEDETDLAHQSPAPGF